MNRLFGRSGATRALLVATLASAALLAWAPTAQAAPGFISGTVTDSAGEPLGGVTVTAYDVETGEPGDPVATGENGDYELAVAPGRYTVEFDNYGEHVTEYWPDQVTSQLASPLVVEEAGRTGIDAQLSRPAAFVGQVVDKSGEGIPDVYVEAIVATDPDWSNYVGVAGDTTDQDGFYYVGVRPGTYRLQFTPDLDRPYVGEFFDDATEAIDAIDVTVLAEDTTVEVADAELAGAYGVSGTVTDGAEPLDGIAVEVSREVDDDWEVVEATTTDADGAYAVGRLRSDTYRIGFVDDSDTYLDTSRSLVIQSSDVFGVDAQLAPAAHLAGRVTNGSGNPVADAVVYAHKLVGGGYVVEDDFVAISGGNGVYDVGNLPSGTYRLEFYDPSTSAYEVWNNQPSLERGFDIVVGRGAFVGGKDAVLIAGEHDPVVAPPPPVPAPTPAPPTPPPTPPVPTPVARKVENVERPKLKGDFEVGETVKVTQGEWTPGNVDLDYQWFADGKRIKKATKAKLELTRKMKGDKLTVEVTATASGYLATTVETRASSRVKP